MNSSFIFASFTTQGILESRGHLARFPLPGIPTAADRAPNTVGISNAKLLIFIGWIDRGYTLEVVYFCLYFKCLRISVRHIDMVRVVGSSPIVPTKSKSFRPVGAAQ
ncbi:hypothetical protein D3C84_1039820 [compost metagenome]